MAISTITDTTATGEAVRSADILPFPVRPAAKPGPTADQARLVKALDALNAALADQRAALAAWRTVLGELKASTLSLDESLQRYRSNLRTLGNSVSSLREKTRTLEKWADDAIAGQE